jgi:hypothetical protein
MSTSPDPATSGRLVVRPSGEAAGISRRRILVIDSHLALVQFGFGRLECAVAAGLYRVRVESDCDPHEESVVILPGRTAEVEYANTRAHLLCSPAPVPGSTSGREQFREPLAQVMARHQAEGERIYVMVTQRAEQASTRPVSLRGWSVIPAGAEETRLEEAETEVDPAGWWAIATLPARPGGHLLQWRDAKLGLMQQALWLPAGWVLLVFLGHAADREAADPEGLSIHLAPVGCNFAREERGGVLEAALKSLRDGRMYLPEEEVEAELLGATFDDPWLGIVLAHLVLQRKRKEVPAGVLKHLEQLAPGHPDVAALRAQSGIGKGEPVSWPPMIRRGMEAICTTDWAGESIVGGTLPDAIRSTTLAGEFWTRWPAIVRAERRRGARSRGRTSGSRGAAALTDPALPLSEIVLAAAQQGSALKRTALARLRHTPTKALLSQLKNFLDLYQTINGRPPDARALAWAGLKEEQVSRVLRAREASGGKHAAATATVPMPKGQTDVEGKITPTPALSAVLGSEPVTPEELKHKLRDYLLQRGVEPRRAVRAASLLRTALGKTILSKADLEPFIRRNVRQTEENA